MSPSDRTSLIVDLFALADSGKRTYDITLDMVLRSMNKEEHYVPWRVFRNNLKYIGNMLMSSVHFGKWLVAILDCCCQSVNDVVVTKRHHEEKILLSGLVLFPEIHPEPGITKAAKDWA